MLRLILSATLLALSAVRRNKLRATLTVLGILIGVAAVVIVSALGNGAQASVGASIASLGSNLIIVFPQSANASGARGQSGSGGRLTEDDGRALVRESTSIKAWAPQMRATVQIVSEGKNSATSAIGSTRAFFDIRAWAIDKGEIWSESSETIKEKVCVLGATTRTNLFGTDDPVGRSVRIGRYSFRVVGVLEAKGGSGLSFGGDQDDVVLMPIGTFRSRISGGAPGVVQAIMVSAASDDVNERAVKQATEILKQRHHIGEGKEPDFAIRSQAEFQATQRSIFDALEALLISVAAVSLVVGGIGVMNIMLVSVAERTREIGIRMAIGAQEMDILVQFLVEAIVLSLLGGIAGLLVSGTMITLTSLALGWTMRVDPTSLFVALGTSMTIGLVFGFFPARRAAQLDPIQALRRE